MADTKNSIVGDRATDGTVSYKCLNADKDKLPTDVPTGSTCYIVDTGDILMFEETSERWYEQ